MKFLQQRNKLVTVLLTNSHQNVSQIIIRKFKLYGMSFFQKDDTEKNLQYDDIAFLHFLLTLSLMSVAFFGYLVLKRLREASVKSIKNYKKIKASGLFNEQLKNQAKRLKKLKLTTAFKVFLGIFCFSIILSVNLIYFIGSHQTQMIGFDPHQILGLPADASTTQIKKAYRKLALDLHPDRNPNNPEAHAKFIMVSKAYECLTDEEKKLNCLKFGNPDGQASFQVGIGLPKFLISKQNQFIILPIVFTIFLVLIPMIFINWTKGLKAVDAVGFQRSNYPALHYFYRPDFNATFGFYLVTALKQMETQKKLEIEQKMSFLEFLNQKRLIDVKYVMEKMSEGQIYVLHQLLKQMALKEPDADLCERLPELLNGLMNFSLYFARRINDKKFLLPPDSLPINWIGTQHLFMLLEFMRTFYNCSLFNPPGFSHFDFLEMAPEDQQISFRNPVGSLKELISNRQRVQQHLALFPEHHRDHLQRQIDDLPILNLQVKIMVGKQQVQQFYTDDFPQIYFKVEKRNQTSGYCYHHRFPFLKEEKYYFMLVYGSNLIHFQQVVFQEGKNIFVGKFPYRQSFANQMRFFALLESDSRYGLQAHADLTFNVVEPRQDVRSQPIEFHHEDREIQKLPKNGFEKALSLEVENPSDNELSDSEENEKDEQQRQERPQRGMRMERQHQHSGCCDH